MSNGRYDGDPFLGQVVMYGGPPSPVAPVSPSPLFAPSTSSDLLLLASQLRLEIAKQFESVRAGIRDLESKIEETRTGGSDEVARLRKRNASLRKEIAEANRTIQKLEKKLESKQGL